MDCFSLAKSTIMTGNESCNNLIDVELGVADTPELVAEARNVIYQAFLEYLLCKWLSEGVTEEDGLREEYHKLIVNFFANYGAFNVSTPEKGVFGFARSSETKEMVACFVLANRKARYSGGNFFLKIYHSAASEIGDLIDIFRMGIPPALYLHRYGIEAFRRVLAMDELTRQHNNLIGNQDHLYLIQLAVLPSMQGKKLGEFMLQKINKIADTLRMPMYLETDTLRHERFYTKFGFRTRSNYILHSGSIRFEPNFGMVRDAIKESSDEQEPKVNEVSST